MRIGTETNHRRWGCQAQKSGVQNPAKRAGPGPGTVTETLKRSKIRP